MITPALSASPKSESSSGSVDAALGGDADEAHVETDSAHIHLTHLAKVFWPESKTTKRDLLAYYWKVRDTLLPYLKDRPLILKRYPNGVEHHSFYQHNVEGAPDYVRIFPVQESSGEVCYAVCDNPAAMLYVVNLGQVAFNPWHSTTSNLQQPTWIVFDLDPADVPWDQTCLAALTIRDVLASLGLQSYPKTSGVSGIHIYVPIQPVSSYRQAFFFGKALGSLVVNQLPDLVTTQRSIKNRNQHTIYLDTYQNSIGKTIVSPYSVREGHGPYISTPLEWSEVERSVPITQFTIDAVVKRILEKRDIFEPVLSTQQSLEDALKQLGQGDLQSVHNGEVNQ